MIPSDSSSSPDSLAAKDFEQLVQDGITAVKNGNRSLAVKLFEQAAMINDTDVRIWIWMSATTDDMDERRQYLEHAVALDPSNATAKRGLMLVTGMLDRKHAEAESSPPVQTVAPAVDESTTKTYLCPNCGATISFSPKDATLVCQFCGFTRKVEADVIRDSKDQLLDAALPTERAHRWVDSRTRVTCEQCGVVILLPAGQTADTCPYCASNRFITPSSQVEMVDPEMIGVFKVDPKDAGESIRSWLRTGWLSPDNLAVEHGGMQLHPAYYPFWLFEGTVEIPWFCDANVGGNRSSQWEAHTGSEFENFTHVLIPGLRKITPSDLASIEPFNLDELVEFSPDYLAGWVALTYDHPLADASLRAREKVLKKALPDIASRVEPDHKKRNFSTGAGKWSGLTYKLALLPIYTGQYLFQGQRYHLLVNGQTGKIGGNKPVDRTKTLVFAVIGIIVLFLIVLLLYIIFRAI
jgi:DNA-directed RNA polymerase subunit RPC12/RpoP